MARSNRSTSALTAFVDGDASVSASFPTAVRTAALVEGKGEEHRHPAPGAGGGRGEWLGPLDQPGEVPAQRGWHPVGGAQRGQGGQQLGLLRVAAVGVEPEPHVAVHGRGRRPRGVHDLLGGRVTDPGNGLQVVGVQDVGDRPETGPLEGAEAGAAPRRFPERGQRHRAQPPVHLLGLEPVELLATAPAQALARGEQRCHPPHEPVRRGDAGRRASSVVGAVLVIAHPSARRSRGRSSTGGPALGSGPRRLRALQRNIPFASRAAPEEIGDLPPLRLISMFS